MGKYCLLSNQQEIEQFVQYYKRHPYARERSKSVELFIYIFLGLDFITKIICKDWCSVSELLSVLVDHLACVGTATCFIGYIYLNIVDLQK